MRPDEDEVSSYGFEDVSLTRSNHAHYEDVTDGNWPYPQDDDICDSKCCMRGVVVIDLSLLKPIGKPTEDDDIV